MWNRIRNNPALVIGIIAAAIMGALQAAAGAELISADLVATVGRFFDNPATPDVPLDGYGASIILAFVIRFFVSPAESPGL